MVCHHWKQSKANASIWVPQSARHKGRIFGMSGKCFQEVQIDFFKKRQMFIWVCNILMSLWGLRGEGGEDKSYYFITSPSIFIISPSGSQVYRSFCFCCCWLYFSSTKYYGWFISCSKVIQRMSKSWESIPELANNFSLPKVGVLATFSYHDILPNCRVLESIFSLEFWSSGLSPLPWHLCKSFLVIWPISASGF